MIRTQIQLTVSQSQELRSIAQLEDVSMAELVRRSIDCYLKIRLEPSWAERRERALSVMGKYASGIKDTAVNHDKYLDEIYGDFGK